MWCIIRARCPWLVRPNWFSMTTRWSVSSIARARMSARNLPTQCSTASTSNSISNASPGRLAQAILGLNVHLAGKAFRTRILFVAPVQPARRATVQKSRNSGRRLTGRDVVNGAEAVSARAGFHPDATVRLHFICHELRHCSPFRARAALLAKKC